MERRRTVKAEGLVEAAYSQDLCPPPASSRASLCCFPMGDLGDQLFTCSFFRLCSSRVPRAHPFPGRGSWKCLPRPQTAAPWGHLLSTWECTVREQLNTCGCNPVCSCLKRMIRHFSIKSNEVGRVKENNSLRDNFEKARRKSL